MKENKKSDVKAFYIHIVFQNNLMQKFN